MYIAITGIETNKDVYICRSYHKENGKTSSKIHRKLGKLNDLLDKFGGDYDTMMAWQKRRQLKIPLNIMPGQAVSLYLYPGLLTSQRMRSAVSRWDIYSSRNYAQN